MIATPISSRSENETAVASSDAVQALADSESSSDATRRAFLTSILPLIDAAIRDSLKSNVSQSRPFLKQIDAAEARGFAYRSEQVQRYERPFQQLSKAKSGLTYFLAAIDFSHSRLDVVDTPISYWQDDWSQVEVAGPCAKGLLDGLMIVCGHCESTFSL